jgi:EmrB/QacA subfamily drug resistance transporter
LTAAADTYASPGQRRLTLCAVSLALAMVLVDNTVVNVAIPSIQRTLHATLGTLEWTVNAYTLAIAVFLVTGGRLGDLFGRRRVFVTGIVLFALASAAVAAAPSAPVIIAGRAAQGLAAALLMPGTLSLLTRAYPAEQWGRAIGIWSGISGIALVLGPLLGGAIIEAVSWRAIFLINIPISIVAVTITLRAVKESRDEDGDRSLDLPGIATLTLGLGAVTLALIEGNNWGWTSGGVVALFAVAAVSLAAFVWVETHVRAPMLDLGWMRSRRVAGPNLASLALAFAMFGMLFFITIYLQRGLGYSPLEAGLAFLPSTGVGIVAAVVAGRLSDRIGTTIPTLVGLALAALSAWIASGVTLAWDYGDMVPSFILLGVGMGLVLAPTSTAVMNAVEGARVGVASGVVSMVRMIGGALGVAVLGAVFQSTGRARVNHAVDELWLPLPRHFDIVKSLSNPSSVKLPADLRRRLTTIAHQALIDALADALLVCAGVTAATLVVAWIVLWPRRAALRRPQPEPVRQLVETRGS